MDWIRTIFDPRHPVQKADRLRFHQRHRYIIGLTIADDMSSVQGCLLEGLGAGKLLRLRALAFEQVAISQPTRQLFQQWYGDGNVPYCTSGNPDFESFQSLQEDFTQLAVQTVFQLLSQAGAVADRVLAVAIHHCGIWVSRAGRSGLTLPLIDAPQLALATGANVLDQFPVRDRLDGGTGWPLSALPLWLLWADRRSPTAYEHRVLVERNNALTMTWLPPSDGLDATYPAVHQQRYEIDTANVSAADVDYGIIGEKIAAGLKDWSQVPKSIAVPHELPPFHKIRIIVSGQPQAIPGLVRELSLRFGETQVNSCEDHHCPNWGLGALIAGTHGFLHIDQVPANLPWISGTEFPRILGTLNPGAAARYRVLLVEMSDYRPPVMTLREAV